MHSVWILHHVRPEDDLGPEDVKLIGVYSTRASAEIAIGRLRLQPGFRDWPDAFECNECIVDEDHWTEGFIRQE